MRLATVACVATLLTGCPRGSGQQELSRLPSLTSDDPQAEAMGLFPTVPHPDGGVRTIANPIQIQGVDTRPAKPAPEPSRRRSTRIIEKAKMKRD